MVFILLVFTSQGWAQSSQPSEDVMALQKLLDQYPSEYQVEWKLNTRTKREEWVVTCSDSAPALKRHESELSYCLTGDKTKQYAHLKDGRIVLDLSLISHL